ncbi:hypothetical protein J6590_002145 [Homalodisca vitripennis]|nr:hypothetical protein J6590_002145 [Homalodisca vitripennis]
MAIGAGKGIRSDQPPSSFIGFLLLPWVRHVDAGSYHACCATWVSHTSLSSSVTTSACFQTISDFPLPGLVQVGLCSKMKKPAPGSVVANRPVLIPRPFAFSCPVK